MSKDYVESHEKFHILNEIFHSSLPHKWALVNIAGFSEEEATKIIKNRNAHLKAQAKLNYKLARLEQNGK